jgi:NAD(P)-dependent dehydrogenase (short-subunit alcohol dehydrogenase family)
MNGRTKRRDLTDLPFRLDGKVAWITGAGRGLGRSLAFTLAEAGAELLLMARGAEPLAEVAETITESGGRAHMVAGSISDAGDIAHAVAIADQNWGRVDVLVNNASTSESFVAAERIEDRHWRHVLEANLTGPFLCCKAARPLMKAAGGGSIVNISSVSVASSREPLAHSISKSGLETLTRILAVEWAAEGIRVNCVAPEDRRINSTAAPLRREPWAPKLRELVSTERRGDAGEVGAAVLFLASAASGYLTGASLPVGGRRTAR